MTSRLTGTWRLLLKELSGFGVVGAVAFVADVGLFQVLYAHAGVNAVVAKLISTVVGVTVAYLGHRYWSFSHRARTGFRREYTLFAVVNAVTLALGLVIVWFVRYPLDQESPLVLQVANLVSIALGTIVRFTAYRRWVFPEKQRPAADHEPASSDPHLRPAA